MLRRVFAISLVALLSGVACASNDSSNPDCAQAESIWGTKTKHLGQKCYAGSYGSCSIDYDDCIEGVCMSTGNGDVCTQSCNRDQDCGGDYCRQGLCTPAASCSTYCDGTCCCDYYQDPNDPTQCRQGSCFCG